MRAASEIRAEVLVGWQDLLFRPQLRSGGDDDLTEILQLHYVSLLVFIDQLESKWSSIKDGAVADGLLDSPQRACPALGALRAAQVPVDRALHLEMNAVYAELVAPFQWANLAHSQAIERPFSDGDPWWSVTRTREDVRVRYGRPNLSIRDLVWCYLPSDPRDRWIVFSFRSQSGPGTPFVVRCVRHGRPVRYFVPGAALSAP